MVGAGTWYLVGKYFTGPSAELDVISGKPHLVYFPAAGRGELIRLIAAAGGVEITESTTCSDKAAYGSPSGIPVLAVITYQVGHLLQRLYSALDFPIEVCF